MRANTLGATILTAVLLIPLYANGEIASVYVQGHGGYGGGDTGELMPGGEDPALGPAVGVEAGARLFIVDAYLAHDAFFGGGSVSRAVLGLRGGVSVGSWRLTLRAGGGVLGADSGALGGEGTDEEGVVGRAGAALEKKLNPRLLVGLGVDGEVFAVRPEGTAWTIEDTRTGSDVFGSARLRFELGI